MASRICNDPPPGRPFSTTRDRCLSHVIELPSHGGCAETSVLLLSIRDLEFTKTGSGALPDWSRRCGNPSPLLMEGARHVPPFTLCFW